MAKKKIVQEQEALSTPTPQPEAAKGVLLAQQEQPQEIGRTGPIGRAEVEKAAETMRKYKDGKASLERRIVSNEQWYKLQHWAEITPQKEGDPEPTSAWLFNSIANKHADAMDNYPQPGVLPREESDEADAELLSQILPAVLEYNDYEQTYSDTWWYKLKMGTSVTGVFWDSTKNRGIGDIDIRKIDLLNLFWEPGITHIQKSRNLFHVDLVDIDILEERYPFLRGKLSTSTLDIAKYVYDDTVDTTNKAVVVDWYYKLMRNGAEVLHFCKFVGGEVLYATENDPEYAERGLYDHGKYPFVFDVLFPEEGMPVGFGCVDICRSPQIYIDKIDQGILKASVLGTTQRYFARGDSSINEKEFTDLTKTIVHYTGSGNPNENIMPIEPPRLDAIYVEVRNQKIDELKETSGNRDFSQGGTAAGVTAASAIAALQEAGSKLSRDMNKSSYRAFANINKLNIELMRQFYTEERWFRVVGDNGKAKYVQFSAQQIAAKPQGEDFGMDMGFRVPVFDIVVTSQKSSPFSQVAQNERAKEMYGMGFFRPDLADQALAALEMMQFEGVEAVRERIAQNGTLFQKLQEIAPLVLAMAAELDAMKGTMYTQQVAQILGMAAPATPQRRVEQQGDAQTNSLGNSFNMARGNMAGSARTKAARASTPE